MGLPGATNFASAKLLCQPLHKWLVESGTLRIGIQDIIGVMPSSPTNLIRPSARLGITNE